MSICPSLLSLCSKEILLVNGEVEMPRDVEPLILAATAQGARVLRKRKLIEPMRTILYGDGYCLLRAEPPEENVLKSHPLHRVSVDATAATFRTQFENTITRYATAHEKGTTVEQPQRDDEIFLAFNSAVWALVQRGVQCIAFPEAMTPVVMTPTDPAKLRCVARDTCEEFLLEDELIDGGYASGQRTGALFPVDDEPTEIVLRLQHEAISQVVSRMTISEAEKIGIRRTKVTGRVRRKNGGVAVFVGTPTFTRK